MRSSLPALSIFGLFGLDLLDELRRTRDPLGWLGLVTLFTKDGFLLISAWVLSLFAFGQGSSLIVAPAPLWTLRLNRLLLRHLDIHLNRMHGSRLLFLAQKGFFGLVFLFAYEFHDPIWRLCLGKRFLLGVLDCLLEPV